MLVAAAVCPHPPLLVPELAAGAAEETAAVRAAALEAVRRLSAAGPDVLHLVGAAPETRSYAADAAGTLAPYGVDVRVGGPGALGLPLSLTVGRWLLDRAAAADPWTLHGIAPGAAPRDCADLGARLADAAERGAMLAMGDGSACLSERAPGWVDARAGPYDDAVAAALGTADVEALLGLDPGLAADLLAGGRAAWQVLAGAGRASRRPWRGELLARAAPHGVSYLVASWTREWANGGPAVV